MAGGGLRGDHQRKSPAAGIGEHAPPVSIPYFGLSLRQRIGVYQSEGGRDAEQIIGGVHQIASLPDHGQRAGGGQERSSGTQAHRFRPHRERACRSLAQVLHRLLQPLPELSSPVRICHGGHRSAGQAQTPLPSQRLPHPLREAGVVEEVEGILEARDHGGSAGTAVQRTQRHRSGTAHAEGQTGAVGQMPEHAAMTRTHHRLPLVGPEHQWVGRQKPTPGRVGVRECGAPPVGRPRASVGRPAKNHPRKGWCSGVWRASRWSAPSISGWAGKKPSQEGLVFGSVARLPLVGPEHQWVGRQKPKAISNTHTERRIPEQSTQVVSSSISGSLTIGNESPFQAHSVLESSSDFRLILRLENAPRPSYNGPMRFGTAILALPLAMACAAACLADTLTLRNGQVVQGTYMGGTARTVKMQVDDTVKTYDVTDIATLQFTPPGPTASATLAPGHRRPGTTGAAAPKAPAESPQHI